MIRVGYYIPAYGQSVHPGVWRQGFLEGRESALLGEYEVLLSWTDTNGVDLARNQAIEQAREAGLDYLFMQDADTYADQPVSPRLVDIARTEGAALAAAAYPLRRGNSEVGVYPLREGEVYEADFAATGLMLVDLAAVARVAEKYEGPWCMRAYSQRGDALNGGGDMYLCHVMREHGESVWVDTTVPTHHMRKETLSFRPSDGETQRERLIAEG